MIEVLLTGLYGEYGGKKALLSEITALRTKNNKIRAQLDHKTNERNQAMVDNIMNTLHTKSKDAIIKDLQADEKLYLEELEAQSETIEELEKQAEEYRCIIEAQAYELDELKDLE